MVVNGYLKLNSEQIITPLNKQMEDVLPVEGFVFLFTQSWDLHSHARQHSQPGDLIFPTADKQYS